jgi:hypothetical protein
MNARPAILLIIGASPVTTLYTLLLDPNIIFLLFIVAMIGIFVEVSHPGAIFPGVVGSIALILFIFGAWFLSPNWAGLALMALAFVLLVLDIKLPAHGILTLGAVVSLIVGALLFFNSGGPTQGLQVNPILVFAMGGLVGLIGLYVVTLIVRIGQRSVKTGTDSMIGLPSLRRLHFNLLDVWSTKVRIGPQCLTIHPPLSIQALKCRLLPLKVCWYMYNLLLIDSQIRPLDTLRGHKGGVPWVSLWHLSS